MHIHIIGKNFFATKCNQYLIRQTLFLCNLIQCIIISNCTLNVFRYDHCLCFSFQFMVPENLCVEMAKHYIGFCGNGLRVAFYRLAKFLLSPLAAVFGIVLYTLSEFVVTLVCGVICQNIKYKSLLNCLFHTIQMEGMEFSFAVLASETLKSFPFRCGGKGEIRAVATHLTLLYHFIQQCINIASISVGILLYSSVQFASSNTALRAVRLINNDSKVMVAYIADCVADNWKLLYSSNNNTLPVLNMLFQSCPDLIASTVGTIGMGNYLGALSKHLYVVGNLLVEQTAVGNHNYRIVKRSINRLCPDGIHSFRTSLYEFVCQPSKRV